MSFDFTKTVALIKGGLLDHETTWNTYLDENPDWQKTALALTGPLILANVLLSLVFSRMIGGFAYFADQANFFTALLSGLIIAVISFLVAVLVFNYLAGVFKGKPDFSRAFAAVSLAAIPAWIAGILAALIPAIGFVIALAGGITSLVFVYKILPLALEIPADKRVGHFIASLVVILIANIVVGITLNRSAMRDGAPPRISSRSESASPASAPPGMLGEMERQGQLMERAGSDVFDPPADGKLDEQQVVEYVDTMRKTRSVQEEYADRMQKLAADIEAKEKTGESASFADLSRMYGSVGSVVGINTAEMEVVKTGGGNWAEHQWVKQQLRIARVQQGDGSEANAHNYALYRKYEQDLDDSHLH